MEHKGDWTSVRPTFFWLIVLLAVALLSGTRSRDDAAEEHALDACEHEMSEVSLMDSPTLLQRSNKANGGLEPRSHNAKLRRRRQILLLQLKRLEEHKYRLTSQLAATAQRKHVAGDSSSENRAATHLANGDVIDKELRTIFASQTVDRIGMRSANNGGADFELGKFNMFLTFEEVFIWLQHICKRMSEEPQECGVGMVMSIYAVLLLWVNEKRRAQFHSLISKGETDCIENVDCDNVAPDNNGRIVHAIGRLSAQTTVKDDMFDVSLFETVRLQTKMEVYQWHETECDETDMGIDKDAATGFTHDTHWSEKKSDDRHFNDCSPNFKNTYPAGDPFVKINRCKKVRLAHVVDLSPDLVDLADVFQDAGDMMFQRGVVKDGKLFQKGSTGPYYYFREGAGEKFDGAEAEPLVGDSRVSFYRVPDGAEVSVVAVQAKKHDVKHVYELLPYRDIRRWWFGWTDEDEKRALLAEGKNQSRHLEVETEYAGFVGFLCCFCSIAHILSDSSAPHQIFYLTSGRRSKQECFHAIRKKSPPNKWTSRAFCLLLLTLGLAMLLRPVLVFKELGPWSVIIVSTCLDVIIVAWVFSCAYLLFDPIWGCSLATAAMTLTIITCALLQQPGRFEPL